MTFADDDIFYRRVPSGSKSHYRQPAGPITSATFTRSRLAPDKIPGGVSSPPPWEDVHHERGLSVDIARLTTVERACCGKGDDCIVVAVRMGDLKELGYTVEHDPVRKGDEEYDRNCGPNEAHALILDREDARLYKKAPAKKLSCLAYKVDQSTGALVGPCFPGK